MWLPGEANDDPTIDCEIHHFLLSNMAGALITDCKFSDCVLKIMDSLQQLDLNSMAECCRPNVPP